MTANYYIILNLFDFFVTMKCGHYFAMYKNILLQHHLSLSDQILFLCYLPQGLYFVKIWEFYDVSLLRYFNLKNAIFEQVAIFEGSYQNKDRHLRSPSFSTSSLTWNLHNKKKFKACLYFLAKIFYSKFVILRCFDFNFQMLF